VYFDTAAILGADGVALPQNEDILYGQRVKTVPITQDTSDRTYLLRGLQICLTQLSYKKVQAFILNQLSRLL